MTSTTSTRWVRAVTMMGALAMGLGSFGGLACSSSGDLAPAATEHASRVVGPAGGSVTTSNGTGVSIPAGALPSDTTITVDATPSATPPAGTTEVSTPYTFGPEGEKFAAPVTVTLAFDPSALPAGRTANDVVVFTAPAGTTHYTPLATSIVDATHATAQTSHFSVFVCVVPNETVVVDAGGERDATLDANDASDTLDGGTTQGDDATSADDGGDIDGGWIDGGSIDAGSTDSGPSVEPPDASGGTTAVTAVHDFAIHHMHLGDEIDPSTSKADWLKYGYDIDGKSSTAQSTDVCTLATNSNKANQADAPGGIDNSFGKNIAPVLAAVMANPSAAQDSAIAAGTLTLMLDVKGLDEANLAQTATGLAGQLFGGVSFNQGPNGQNATPTFTSADDWPLDVSFLQSGVLDGGALATPVVSREVFSSAYVENGTFVGHADEATLTIAVAGASLVLEIQHATITFTNGGAHGSNGILSGVIATQDLVDAFLAVAGNISTSFCGGSAASQQLATVIEQSADILLDGTNVAGVACDGISIGVGFDLDEIGPPQVAGVSAPVIDPCAVPDAGDGG